MVVSLPWSMGRILLLSNTSTNSSEWTMDDGLIANHIISTKWVQPDDGLSANSRRSNNNFHRRINLTFLEGNGHNVTGNC